VNYAISAIAGFALDRFSAGFLGLKPTTKKGQKIGTKIFINKCSYYLIYCDEMEFDYFGSKKLNSGK
jgi:hypothetical protein